MKVLTFDVEEWFHILDNDSTRTHLEWQGYESRIHANMERIFSILDAHNQSATFFCLGWIARRYPDIIREIVQRGYEIGSHTSAHQLIFEQTPLDFDNDLKDSIHILEDVSGQKVKYFRAPGFSIKEENKWAFEVLVNNGIEVDCSIFPADRAHGGFPSFSSASPSRIVYNGITIKELPLNTVKLFGKPVIFSGGGYFRLFPYWFIKRWTQRSAYMMCYIHPRDLDARQPLIRGLSALRRFKSYVGLGSAAGKFNTWLNDFRFVDIRTALRQTQWDRIPAVYL